MSRLSRKTISISEGTYQRLLETKLRLSAEGGRQFSFDSVIRHLLQIQETWERLNLWKEEPQVKAGEES